MLICLRHISTHWIIHITWFNTIIRFIAMYVNEILTICPTFGFASLLSHSLSTTHFHSPSALLLIHSLWHNLRKYVFKFRRRSSNFCTLHGRKNKRHFRWTCHFSWLEAIQSALNLTIVNMYKHAHPWKTNKKKAEIFVVTQPCYVALCKYVGLFESHSLFAVCIATFHLLYM